MFKKILKSLFPYRFKDYVSNIDFRPGIIALAMENYKGINILYLSKPTKSSVQPMYHFFYRKEFYAEEADTLDELKQLAHNKIDELK